MEPAVRQGNGLVASGTRLLRPTGMSGSNIMAVSSLLCLKKSTRLLIPVKFQCACWSSWEEFDIILFSSLKQYKKEWLHVWWMQSGFLVAAASPESFIHLVTSNHCSGLPHILHLCTQVCPFLFSLFASLNRSDPVLSLVLILSAVLGSNFFCVTSPAWEWVQCLPREPFVFKDLSTDVSVIDYSAGCTFPLSWKTNPSASWKRQTLIHEKLLFWRSVLPNEGFQWKPNLKICEA